MGSQQNMKNAIRISVVVPVYNVKKYLTRCLDSLVSQTLHDIEIICVDDGSTDGSGAILDDYAARDARVIVVHKQNAGVSAARNDALAIARGEYIAFTDSDDYVEPSLCEETYRCAIKSNADIVVFGGEVFSESINTSEYLKDAFNFFKDNLNVKDALYVDNSIYALMHQKGSWPLIWNKIYKRELVLRSGGFDTSLALGEDEAFLFSIYPLANRILYIDRKFYHYLRNRPESATDRLVMDFEGKAFSNLRMAQTVKKKWEDLGIFEKNSQEFLNRYIELLFDNAKSIEYAPDTQLIYTQKVFSFLNECTGFAKYMIDHWYEMLWLRSERANLQKETEKKQNEIWALINSKNISDGQVQVLKEVALAHAATEEEQVKNSHEQVVRQKRSNAKKSSGKLKRLLKDFKCLFNSDSLKNIKNIADQDFSKGLKTYQELKFVYGARCVFFTCAFAGIGDAYLVGCYIEEWLKKNKVADYRFLLCGKSEKKMIEALFPLLKDKCVLITQTQHEWLRNFTRLCDFKPDFYFFHHYDYMQPHLQLTEKLQGYRGLNMRDLYLWKMGLPQNSICRQPSAPLGQEQEISAIFSKFGLQKGKTVVIAPYSTCLGGLSDKFWGPIVDSLKARGYSVCSNCNSTEKPVIGTCGIFIEFKYLLNFINTAGYFIGIRSGLCDVISSCSAHMIVIHPYHSVQWGDGNAIKYVGLVNMGFNDGHNLLELELSENDEDEFRVQREIIERF